MRRFLLFLLLLLVFAITGCTSYIPMRTTIDPNVEKKMKSPSQLDVSFTFNSSLTANLLPLYDEYKQEIVSNGSFICDESATLEIMTTNYMQKRFHALNPKSKIQVKVNLDSLYAQEYYTENGVRKLLPPSASRRNLTHVSEVIVVVTVTIDNNGNIQYRTVRGRQDVSSLIQEQVMCDALFDANNQILSQMEDFFVENGL